LFYWLQPILLECQSDSFLSGKLILLEKLNKNERPNAHEFRLFPIKIARLQSSCDNYLN
jgi:hypothetical protein